MKTYMGSRFSRRDGSVSVLVDGNALPVRLDLCNHSPTGFEWGYGGSGPAQLALALLADALGDDAKALQLYQRFKFDRIAGFAHAGWLITEDAIKEWAAAEEVKNGGI